MTSKPEVSPDRAAGILGACLGVGVVLALLVFLFLGLTIWSAAVAALLLVCPVVLGWGTWVAARRKPPRLRDGKPPYVSAE